MTNDIDHSQLIILKAIDNAFEPSKILLMLIESRLEKYDIKLSFWQKIKFKIKYRNNDDSEIIIPLTNRQEKYLRKQNSNIDKVFDFSEIIPNLTEELSSTMIEPYIETIDMLSDNLLEAWKKQAPKILKKIHKYHFGFNRRLSSSWGSILDQLETLIELSFDFGSEFNHKFRQIASQENNFIFEVLSRSHARSCQISNEIITLLRNGFADGAHARWRSLHELDVITTFISLQDNNFAKRYLDHQSITNYKDANIFQDHHKKIGYSPIPNEEIEVLKINYAKMIEEYGINFKNQYGWASELLNNPFPNFTQIEEYVGYDHMRPFVKLANINNHAGSNSLYFRLGMSPEDEEILVAGRSIFGLSIPIQNTAYSLKNLTTSLLASQPNLDRTIIIKVLDEITNEIFELINRTNQNFQGKDQERNK